MPPSLFEPIGAFIASKPTDRWNFECFISVGGLEYDTRGPRECKS